MQLLQCLPPAQEYAWWGTQQWTGSSSTARQKYSFHLESNQAFSSLKAQDLNYFIEFIMENKSYTIHGYYAVKTWSVKYMFTFNICSI